MPRKCGYRQRGQCPALSFTRIDPGAIRQEHLYTSEMPLAGGKGKSRGGLIPADNIRIRAMVEQQLHDRSVTVGRGVH